VIKKKLKKVGRAGGVQALLTGCLALRRIAMSNRKKGKGVVEALQRVIGSWRDCVDQGLV
jgi:hypothetical protein